MEKQTAVTIDIRREKDGWFWRVEIPGMNKSQSGCEDTREAAEQAAEDAAYELGVDETLMHFLSTKTSDDQRN
jgi:hypothetical protein